MMKVTFLGTGTSHGVPVVGCTCSVCMSDNKKNKRNRSSVVINWDDVIILIDTPPELRLSALSTGLSRVDAVLFTHDHADHVAGFDDLRRLSGKNNPVDLFAESQTARNIKKRFSYAFSRPKQIGGGLPNVKLHTIKRPWSFRKLQIIPLPARHGNLPVYGYRLGDFAYVTDVKTIPRETLVRMTGLKALVLGVLRYRPHSTHLNLEEALKIINLIKPQKTFLTHLAHDFDHRTLSQELPEDVTPGWDGLTFTV